MSTRQPSRVVFVGNIPYGLTEEQITEIFSGAGRVLNFRLVYDRETGRPKGFGFAEFPDYDSAASAVRNLNDHEIMGRKLRVDFSNETVSDEDNNPRGDQNSGPPVGMNLNMAGYPTQQQQQLQQPTNGGGGNMAGPGAPTGSLLPPLPPGKDLPPGMTCTDAISRTLNTLPPPQLLDIIQQMKTLATNEPHRATELLNQAPQLSYAIFQALLIMGLVSPDAINSVLDTSAAPPVAAPAPAPLSAAGPTPVGYGFPGATSTPPVALGGGYAPPPVAAPVAAPAPAAPAGQDPEALMQAVLDLPQAMIDQFPEAERQQIMALRASYGQQNQRR
ncbi:hinge domain of cleavage stimulation factor subunit 2-domain-containing protein [Podospora didyma]|uniref:Hinge domain of cleavage stimulation factor subunit 2-domain-containing protein n=1 Tax=Podospora didyma TaxID=330526 RepID=A0AAE0P672_9PEZI|nr:hinge domain of cleavage stimulation factor subunit 2-domain-containing protein [Podospora didyma]